jgi:NAD+ diphosphatase
MNFCFECGTKLIEKDCSDEGLVPFCKSCNAFRFPIFNTAISTAVFNPAIDKVLLIQQYNRPAYILVAGYVNKGETAEEALTREVSEEIGLSLTRFQYMRSSYFEKSNTLMLNYMSVADSEDLSRVSTEVDVATWFSMEEAKQQIMPGSLAENFLLSIFNHLEQIKKQI